MLLLLEGFLIIGGSAIEKAEAGGINTINALLVTVIFVALIYVFCFVLLSKAKNDDAFNKAPNQAGEQ